MFSAVLNVIGVGRGAAILALLIAVGVDIVFTRARPRRGIAAGPARREGPRRRGGHR